jgi:hypothetical protein
MRGRGGGRIRLRVEYGDIGDFHADPANAHATFQCASQFNCLEFIAPHVVPEDGVTGYFGDRTQGPACAIACGPGTIYRNYFVRAADLHGGVWTPAVDQVCDPRTAVLCTRQPHASHAPIARTLSGRAIARADGQQPGRPHCSAGGRGAHRLHGRLHHGAGRGPHSPQRRHC